MIVTGKWHRWFVFLLAVVFVACLSDISARRIKTTHKVKSVSSASVESDDAEMQSRVEADTTLAWKVLSEKIKFSGFDKTPSSNKESFFITNSTDSTLHGLKVNIRYTDLSDRLLHERSVEVDCDIPPSGTRRVDIPTWDLQHAFRHYRSPATRRPTTPFRVAITPLSLSFHK